jgi:hypothetical protein
MHVAFWSKAIRKETQYEDLEVGGRIIIKLVLREYDGVIWTGLI